MFQRSSIIQQIPVYVINLDRRTNRLTHIKNEFEREILAFERVSAVDGQKTLNENYLRLAAKYLSEDAKITDAQRACALSHVALWDRLQKNKVGHALILEDDAILPKSFRTIIYEVLDSVPNNWDFISFNCAWCKGKQYNSKVYQMINNICSICYAISDRGIRKLLNMLQKKKIIYKHRCVFKYTILCIQQLFYYKKIRSSTIGTVYIRYWNWKWWERSSSYSYSLA